MKGCGLSRASVSHFSAETPFLSFPSPPPVLYLCCAAPLRGSRQRRGGCRWKVACPRAAFDGSVFTARRAILPDRNRCHSSCALAAAPDVGMDAMAQTRYFGASFINRSLFQAGPVLFFAPVFLVCSMSLIPQSW